MPTAKRKKTRLTDAEYRRRQAQEARRQARKRRRRYIYMGVAGFVALLVIMSFVIPQMLQSTPSPESLPGYAPELMESHPIPEGEEHEPYTSTPPATGPYYDEPAEWGIYDTELPDERVLRNLQLTGVAINYNLDDQQAIDRLKAIVEGQLDYPCYLILQPYSKIDVGKVALTAWARLDVMDGVDEGRIQEFLDEFHGNENKGLEKPACTPESG